MKLALLFLVHCISFTTAHPTLDSSLSDTVSTLNYSIASNNTELSPVCAICYENVQRPFYYFDCIHTDFHASCIYEYRSHNIQIFCPLCRRRPNPAMPTSVMHNTAHRILLNDSDLFLVNRKRFLLSDEQSVQLASAALMSSIYTEVIETLQLRNWRPMSRLFHSKILDHSRSIDTDETFSAQRRLMIGMGTLSLSHVREHVNCIIRDLWSCSDDFLAFYTTSIPNESIDLTEVATSSIFREVSANKFAKILALPAAYLPTEMIGYALKTSIDTKNWDLVDLIITFVGTRGTDFMIIFKIARLKIYQLPPKIRTTIMTLVVSPLIGDVEQTDDFELWLAYMNFKSA